VAVQTTGWDNPYAPQTSLGYSAASQVAQVAQASYILRGDVSAQLNHQYMVSPSVVVSPDSQPILHSPKGLKEVSPKNAVQQHRSVGEASQSPPPSSKPKSILYCRAPATLVVVGARYHGNLVLTDQEVQFEGGLAPLGFNVPLDRNEQNTTGLNLDSIAELLGANVGLPKRVVVTISMANLRLVLPRNYYRLPIGLELFTFLHSPAQATYIVFDKHLNLAEALKRRGELCRERDTVLTLLRKLINHPTHMRADDVLRLLDLPRRWIEGRMSTFDYLSWVNVTAGRSFNDITQYPIFPMVLAPTTNFTLNLADRRSFRDLAKPLHMIASKALGLTQDSVLPRAKMVTWGEPCDLSTAKASGSKSVVSAEAENLDAVQSPSRVISTPIPTNPSDLLPEALATYPPVFYATPLVVISSALREPRILRAAIELNNGYLGSVTSTALTLRSRDPRVAAVSVSLGAMSARSIDQLIRKAFSDRCAATELAPFWFCSDPGRVHVIGDDVIFVPDEPSITSTNSVPNMRPHHASHANSHDNTDSMQPSSLQNTVLYDTDGDEALMQTCESPARSHTAIDDPSTAGEAKQMSENNSPSQTLTEPVADPLLFDSPLSASSASGKKRNRLRLTEVHWLNGLQFESSEEASRKVTLGDSAPQAMESKVPPVTALLSESLAFIGLPERDLPSEAPILQPGQSLHHQDSFETILHRSNQEVLEPTALSEVVAILTETLRRLASPMILPAWAGGDQDAFLRLHRAALESPIVGSQLHKWLDMVFGVDQEGPRAQELGNIYFPSVYLRMLPLPLSSGSTPNSPAAARNASPNQEGIPRDILNQALSIEDITPAELSQAVAYGTCPDAIFHTPHPPREKLF